ncbi:hypothetical protein [Terrisporobacter glycolicus]|uniref:Vitamin B12 dependent methionine synthase, activation domain n=1 Tax=Terrisporobacter glycolicus ATCC 14880 = DSM 1288 TaxID=1121315 RepID=A0ABZ2EUG4_9FIRM|nr:hypothetical protein [Terrisporobacter glycolicus]
MSSNFITIPLDIERVCDSIQELKGSKEEVKKLKNYIHPKVYWKDLNIKYISDGQIVIDVKDEEPIIIKSSYICEGLEKCHKITIACATIGNGLPDYSKICMENGESYKSTVSDILGSYTVEELIDKFNKHLLQRNMTKGLYATPRFSPGYGDLDLKNQIKIINLLKIHSEIKVNENYMLSPEKTVTALIGWSFYPRELKYPKGEKKKGLCQGKNSCENCKTWACKK